MFRRCALPLLALWLTPLTLSAAGKPKGDGLTQNEIVTVIQAHSDDARGCYKDALDKDKDAAGKVKIRFLIGLNGKIEASQVEKNTFKDKIVANCLQGKMKTWTFPKPRGQERVSIAYPFEFKTTAPVAPAAPAAPAVPAPPAAPEAPAAPATPATPDSAATAPATPATPATPPAPEAPKTEE